MEANKKLREESKKGSEEAVGGMEKLVKGVAAAATGYMSLRAVLQLVNAELQAKIDLQAKAAESTTTLADAEADLMANLGAMNRAQRDEVFKYVKDVSEATGVSQLMVTRAAPGASSALGTMPLSALGGALGMAARVSPHDQAGMTATATGLLNTAALTKSQNMEENLGFTLGLGQGTQVSNLRDINEKLIPAAIAISQFGDTASDAASVVSTMTSLLKDSTGAISSTASIQLAGQLKEFLPEGDTFKWDARNRKTRDRKGTGLGTTEARMEFLQANPEMRERFLSEFTFEQRAQSGIRSILTGGSEGDILQDQRSKEILGGAPAIALAQGWLADKEGDPRQRVAGLQRKLGQATESLLTSNILNAEGGVSRAGLGNLLRASGAGDLSTKAYLGAFDFGGGGRAGAARALQERREEIAGISGLIPPGKREAAIAGAGMGDASRDIVDNLKKVIDVLQNQKVSLDQIKLRKRTLNRHDDQ